MLVQSMNNKQVFTCICLALLLFVGIAIAVAVTVLRIITTQPIADK